MKYPNTLYRELFINESTIYELTHFNINVHNKKIVSAFELVIFFLLPSFKFLC